MQILDRRSLLSTFAGTLAWTGCRTVAPLSESKSSPTNLLIRPRWEFGKEAAYKQKFIQAVEWLKANDLETFPADDARSFLTWKKILKLHQTSCQHSNWFLLPWHRLYIYYFESACQVALQDPSFALPYWDWSVDTELPEEFYKIPSLMEKRDIVEGNKLPLELVGPDVISRMMASQDFFNFHSYPAVSFPFGTPQVGTFEGTPHNGVHNTVGGFMGSTTDSPTDPVFWLHHCNIDRLWTLWLAAHPESILPYTMATEREVAQGHGWASTILSLEQKEWIVIMPPVAPAPVIPAGEKNRGAFSTLSVKDVLLSDSLGYTYDSIQASPFISTVRIPKQKPKTRFLKKLSASKKSSGDALTSVLTTTTVQAPLDQFKSSPDSFARLVISKLPIPADEALRKRTLVRFFLSVDDIAHIPASFYGEAAFNLPEYVGSHSYFPMGAHPEHAASDSVEAGFDITSALREKLKTGTPAKLTLIALAVNTKDWGKGVEIFPASTDAELSLQLSLADLT